MRCPTCDVEAVEGASYCHKCGQRLSPSEPAPEPADRFQSAVNSLSLGPDRPEEDLWHGCYSSKAMTTAWIISGVISLASLVAGIFWARDGVWWLIVIGVMLAPWLYYFAVLCYRRMSIRYTLTTQRFIHESGILRRVNNRIELLDVDDITFEQGLLDRLVGVGTIRITSHDRTHPELALPGIENVKEVTQVFDNARLTERRRRGLHVEQI